MRGRLGGMYVGVVALQVKNTPGSRMSVLQRGTRGCQRLAAREEKNVDVELIISERDLDEHKFGRSSSVTVCISEK